MSNSTVLIDVHRQPVVECICATMAISGMAVMAIGYLVSPFLVERDLVIFESLSPDDPNWLYYRDIGDAGMFYGRSLFVGGVLVILSLLSALLYFSMRRGITYKLKGNFDRLKLKGSDVA